MKKIILMIVAGLFGGMIFNSVVFGSQVLNNFSITGDIKPVSQNSFISGSEGNITFKISSPEAKTVYVDFYGSLPKNPGLYPINYTFSLNGNPEQYPQGWDYTYKPYFIVGKQKSGMYNLLFLYPMSLNKGENLLDLTMPPNSKISSVKLIDSINTSITKNIQPTGDHYLFYPFQNAQAIFYLTSNKNINAKGEILFSQIELATYHKTSNWSPDNRITPIETLKQQPISINLSAGKKQEFIINLPKTRYGTICSYLVLKENNKILPIHILNYAIIHKRKHIRFEKHGLIMMSMGFYNTNHFSYFPAFKAMGIDWTRNEVGWNGSKPPGPIWSQGRMHRLETYFNLCRKNKIYVNTLTEDSPRWARPKGKYGDFNITHDLSCMDKYLPEWELAWEEYLKKFGDVNLAFNLWNEPWEGGGISGWHATGSHYRKLLRYLKMAVEKADPKELIVAADSSHNTNWKIFAAGMQNDINVISTHYEGGQTSYAYAMAKYYKKQVWDTESWMAWEGDAAIVRRQLYELALGAKKLSPFATQMIYDNKGFPTTTVDWVSTLVKFLNNKKFIKVIQPKRPPFVLLFSKGTQSIGGQSVAAVCTTLADNALPAISQSFRYQFANDNLTMEIQNNPGIKVYDLYGNLINIQRKNGKMYIPVNAQPKYIVTNIPLWTFEKILSHAYYSGLTPVQIVVHQIVKPLPAKPHFEITLTNAYNVPINGIIKVVSQGIKYKNNGELSFTLSPVERKNFYFKVSGYKISPVNIYLTKISVTTNKGQANIKEALTVDCIIQGTINVNGSINQWKKIGAIPLFLTQQTTNLSLLKAWFPWKKFQNLKGFSAEVAFAYDNNYLYMMARVKENNKDKDILPPLLSGKNWNEFFPAPANYIYKQAGPIPGENGDMIKLAFGPVHLGKYGKGWLGKYILFPSGNPLHRFGPYVSTLYSYLVYPTNNGKAELLRARTPNFYYLHPLPIDYAWMKKHCTVQGAKVVVQNVKNGYIYQMAIPWQEISVISPAKNKKIRLSFEVQSGSMGNVLQFSQGKSICSYTTLDFEPPWGAKYSAETQFGYYAGSVKKQ